MNMKKYSFIGVSVVMMVLAAWVWTGCESAEGTSGVGLTPSSVTLGGASSNTSSVAVFTANASGLALPLAWRVANPALGNIISASGSNATYRANAGAKGDNVVTVSDQYGNEGSAVVTQE
jgi:hypothetical protein